ncbi:preprotein translocase subunit SecE [Rhodococcus sp. X156]|uniref:preprotein translocase subunit SecE n=1 Tax=Rhodococcus sp. X156 TaxID=2499145 RepID=UPI001F49702A|nr:preprotein translocase subunit SecE [Rhodococcus sp. X156]
MSDDRDDVTPEPVEGSETGDTAAAGDSHTDPDAAAGLGSEDDSDDVSTAAARPAGKRRSPAARSTRKPATAGARKPDAERAGTKGRPTPAASKQTKTSSGNPATRVIRYLREVVAELRKVIWPTRNQLITYTTVVLVFVAFMVALTYLLDLAFAKAVLTVFG